MSSRSVLITLLTDFGDRDTYVGQLKGAILSVCPDARLVDLTHKIAPGDVAAAAIAWADAISAFPPQTIHLAVVDPGVGSARRGIAAEIGDWRFVCPDNGLLSVILRSWPLQRAVHLQEQKYWRAPVSPVFHGRDVFGPVAGHWGAGRQLTDFGPRLDALPVDLPSSDPKRDGGTITGEVVAIDRFGNLRTNIPAAWLDGSPEQWTFAIGALTIPGLSRYFGERPAGTPVALIGSHGCLEIAVNQNNAAKALDAALGMVVTVQRTQHQSGSRTRGANSARQ